MINNFIHFGCWNNLNTKEKDGKLKEIGCLKKVMELLKENLSGVDFIVVAGDNYYAKKEKRGNDNLKVKQILTEKLKNGFDKLPRELPIYMILGNHDLETNLKNEQVVYYIDNEPEEENSCAILNLENRFKGPNVSYEFFKDIMTENGTLILMFDSDIYSVDAIRFLPCYSVFLGIENPTIEEIQKYQYDLIIQSINLYNSAGNIKNLIMIGHQPITGFKLKDGEIRQLNDIPFFKPVLIQIHKLLPNTVNYYYLCADLHLYQHGTITLKYQDLEQEKEMIISQFIVGTGGTELDKPIPEEITSYTTETINYNMLDSMAACGFLKCKVDDLEPTFQFISIEQMGGKNKTKKRRRNKRKKTKKNINKYKEIKEK
jgi:Icc-related predicted phosphoesterase